MNKPVLFSKASDEWETPQMFFDMLDAEFRFVLDVAATRDNRRVPAYLGPDQDIPAFRDALTVPWYTLGRALDLNMIAWLNPPYSQCRAFIAKAAAEARLGATVVCLVPSRTDTRWFHEHVWDAERQQPQAGVKVRFLRGRLRFGGATAGAPFPSMVIVFRGRA